MDFDSDVEWKFYIDTYTYCQRFDCLEFYGYTQNYGKNVVYTFVYTTFLVWKIQ